MSSELLNKLYRQMPLILAHRGSSYDAPENTLAAFKLARQQGADGVELDTLLTYDGIPVVIHDTTLDKTTNGHGPVSEAELRTIKSLDAGSHFDFAFRTEQVPTLDEAMETLGPEMVVNIELKAPNWRYDGLENAVHHVIKRHNASKRVIVSSFNPIALRRFRSLAPEIPIGFLYAKDEPVYIRWFMMGVSHEARHPQESMITPQFMAWAKSRNFRVNTWTADDPQRIRELSQMGVDAIITNRPLVALEALGRVSARGTVE
jgi:glycerophosphoryl diester phosphodiesterase